MAFVAFMFEVTFMRNLLSLACCESELPVCLKKLRDCYQSQIALLRQEEYFLFCLRCRSSINLWKFQVEFKHFTSGKPSRSTLRRSIEFTNNFLLNKLSSLKS